MSRSRALAVTILALASAASFSVTAKVYRWLDAEGNLHFGDQPPSRDTAEVIKLKPVNTFTEAPLIESSPIAVNNTPTRKSTRVKIYTTRSCSHCKQAKAYMKKKGVAFQELDIGKSSRARKQFDRLGGRGVPLITIGDQQMSGFSPQAFDQLLKRAKGS